MNIMDRDHLLKLIEHPTPDPDALHDPALTAQILELVRRIEAPQPSPARHDAWMWGALAATLTVAALVVPGTGLASDGGLAGAAGLFSGLLAELTVGAAIAATVLATTLARREPGIRKQPA